MKVVNVIATVVSLAYLSLAIYTGNGSDLSYVGVPLLTLATLIYMKVINAD